MIQDVIDDLRRQRDRNTRMMGMHACDELDRMEQLLAKQIQQLEQMLAKRLAEVEAGGVTA